MRSVTLILAFTAVLCAECNCLADELQQEAAWRRFDKLVDVPRAAHSLEWAIDSSDAVVIVVVPKQGENATLKQTLKAARQPMQSWPPTETRRTQAILSLYQPGDEIVCCVRVDRTKKVSRITHYFPLIPKSDPRRQGDSNAYYSRLPKSLSQTEKMYTFRKTVHAGFWHLAVDVHGNIITEQEDLLKRVKQRITHGSRVPANCDREAVEQGKSSYGGFEMYVPLPSELSSAEFPLVLVTPEAEFRKLFFNPSPNGLRSLPPQLINYRDAEVIAGLKLMLTDRMLSQQAWTIPEGNLIQQINYVLKLGEAVRKVDGEDEGKVRVKRYFNRRKTAYEMLQQMGVKVELPVLTP